MNCEPARRGAALNPHVKRVLLGSVCALGLAMALGSSPASAQFQYFFPYQYERPHKVEHKPARKHDAKVNKLPFGEIPKGPLEIFISIEQQRLHFYSDGQLVATEPVATGVPGHLTPLGVFSVIERDRYHHSNLYSNAPMPFMERITWSGVALHEGPGVGHQASHGCIRMPHDFAAKLWMLPTMGMRVIIARQELRPNPFADSHLFVHKDAPPTAELPRSVQTAQHASPGTKSDAEAAGVMPANPQPAAAATPSPVAADKPETKDATAPAASVPSQATSPAPVKAAATPQPMPAAPKDGATAAAPSAPTAPAPAVSGAIASAPPAADMTAPIEIENVPIPLTKPARIAAGSDKSIAIFVSRKTGRIYVRQNFAPLFDAPVTIENPKQPLGIHVYTAMDYLPDHSTFRWTETTIPTSAVSRKVMRWKYVRDGWGRRRRVRVKERIAEPESMQPASTPEEALARIQIPQDVIDQISRLIVPGSSLVVSDQGLGPETGVHTDFIVVTR